MRTIPTKRLHEETLEYLLAVQKSQGRDANGVFLRQRETPDTTRAVQVIMLAVGLMIALGSGLSFLAYVNNPLTPVGQATATIVESVGLALGVGLVVAGVRALRRPLFRSPLGTFVWADPRYVWLVDPGYVRCVEVERIRELEIHGVPYSNSTEEAEACVHLIMGSETTPLAAAPVKDSQRLAAYVNICRHIQKTTGPEKQVFDARPELLGAIALKLIATGGKLSLSDLDENELPTGIPMKNPIEADRAATEPEPRGSLLIPIATAAVVALVSVYSGPRKSDHRLSYCIGGPGEGIRWGRSGSGTRPNSRRRWPWRRSVGTRRSTSWPASSASTRP